MRTYSPKPADIQREWHVIDATDVVLGRLAVQTANLLRGKHKPTFAPHMDMGDFVIIVNASKVSLSGTKKTTKMAYRHSGYPGGLSATPFGELLEKAKEIAPKLNIASERRVQDLSDQEVLQIRETIDREDLEDLARLCRHHGLQLRWFERKPVLARDKDRELRSMVRSFYEAPRWRGGRLGAADPHPLVGLPAASSPGATLDARPAPWYTPPNSAASRRGRRCPTTSPTSRHARPAWVMTA